jgi:hypothetical protein
LARPFPFAFTSEDGALIPLGDGVNTESLGLSFSLGKFGKSLFGTGRSGGTFEIW